MRHNLKNDGAPFTLNEAGYTYPVNEGKSTAGEGRALCSCGQYSKPLPTRAARKAWHAEHKKKEETVTEIPVEQETPAAVETELHTEYPVTGYPEKKLLPAYFFLPLAREAIEPVISEHTSARVAHSERDLTLLVDGSDEDLENIKEVVEALYEVLPRELAEWKRENREYLGLKEIDDPKERHKKGWIMRKDFCVDFTRGFLSDYFGASGSGSTAYQLGVEAANREFEDSPEDLL